MKACTSQLLVLSNLFILCPSFAGSISQALFPLSSILVWPVGGGNEFRRWEEEGSWTISSSHLCRRWHLQQCLCFLHGPWRSHVACCLGAPLLPSPPRCLCHSPAVAWQSYLVTLPLSFVPLALQGWVGFLHC